MGVITYLDSQSGANRNLSGATACSPNCGEIIMATGMSKAKARRNSKTKARASRAKLGLPAKAGKRRPKNIMHDKNGDYTAAPFVARPKDDSPEPKAYMMTHEVKVGDRIPVPSGHVRKDGLEKIASMKRNSKNLSDPFIFDRMATHFVNGLVEV